MAAGNGPVLQQGITHERKAVLEIVPDTGRCPAEDDRKVIQQLILYWSS